MSAREGAWLALGSVVVIAAVSGPWVVSSYFEAQAYNSVTGRQVSTWDAMFLDLRVIAAPEGDNHE